MISVHRVLRVGYDPQHRHIVEIECEDVMGGRKRRMTTAQVMAAIAGPDPEVFVVEEVVWAPVMKVDGHIQTKATNCLHSNLESLPELC